MVASFRWPGLSEALYGSAFTYLVMSISACSWLNVGTSMSFSPTTSGTEPARMAVASWLVSSLGEVKHHLQVLVRRVERRDQCLRRTVGRLAGPEMHCARGVGAERLRRWRGVCRAVATCCSQQGNDSGHAEC